jgi:multiple sugar transport system substrate-binding protein
MARSDDQAVFSPGRRAAIGALAAGGLGFALFGPRGKKEASGGRLVLDYWEKWTGHEGKAMQKVVDDFNNSQSRIFVRYMVTAGIDQKALIAIAGGDPPDVVGLYNYNVPLYAECDAILPLDQFDSSFGVRIENYAQGVQPIMLHPDRTGTQRMWATTNTGGTLAMYYNRTLFREVGLDPSQPPRTFQQLDEACKKLDIIEKDGSIRRVGFMHTQPGWWNWLWGYHFGGSLYNAPNARMTVDSMENIAAFQHLQARAKTLNPKEANNFGSGFATEYSSPRNAFLDNKCAIVIQGPWLANVIQEFKPDLDYGVAPFCVDEGLFDEQNPIGLVESDILVIPRGAKHPEASMEFIAYTQRQDVVEYLSTKHCKNSPLATASEDFMRSHPNRGVAAHYAIAKSSRGFLCPRTRAWPQIKDEFDAGTNQLWLLQQTAQAKLADVQMRTQAYVDNIESQKRRRGYGSASNPSTTSTSKGAPG